MKRRRDDIELKMLDLAREFDARPSLASSVMRQIQGELPQNQPTAWAAATSLLTGSAYWRGFGVAVTVVAVLLWWHVSSDGGAHVVFGQVQQTVQTVDSVVMESEFKRVPWNNSRSLLQRGRAMRIEFANVITIVDVVTGRSMLMNTSSRIAGFESAPPSMANVFHTSSRGFSSPRELLDYLIQVKETAVQRISHRKRGDTNLVCFELPRDDFLVSQGLRSYIWVDPKSRLPVQFETTPEDDGDVAADFLQYVINFQFNVPLDGRLFSLEPPEGYTVLPDGSENLGAVIWRDFGKDVLPLPPEDRQLASPVVELGVGIGSVKLGMSRDQVLQHLGLPDNASRHWEATPEEDERVDEAYAKAIEEATEKNLNGAERRAYVNDALNRVGISNRPANGVFLDYVSRGFGLVITQERGLIRVFCNQPPHSSVRPFTGHTTEGIGIGDTVEEVEDAYGEPDYKDDAIPESDGGLLYRRYNAQFHFSDGKLAKFSFESVANDSSDRE